MDLRNFVRRIFAGGTTQVSLTAQLEELASTIMIRELAIASAINLISSTISKCEFRTFVGGEPVKGAEYYLWNYEPNKNENSTMFIQKLVSSLLYDNEALVVELGGQLYVADSFTVEESALNQDKFTNITIKTLNLNRAFYASEVLYYKLNNRNIRHFLDGTYDQYAESIAHAIRAHLRTAREKGVLDIDATTSSREDFKVLLQEMVEKRLKPFYEANSAVLPMTKGWTYTDVSKTTQTLPSDINERIDYLFTMAGRAFKIPKSLLLGDVSDVKEITNNFLTFCIDPITDLIGEENTRKRYGLKQFKQGNYQKINTNAIKHIDVFDTATSSDKLIGCGAYCIDDIRIKLGDTPLNTEWSKRHYITKNYAEASQLEHLNTKEVEDG